MNYIDVFKQRIKQEVNKHKGDKSFVDSLFDKIKSDIINAGSLMGLVQVDEITLKSYFETAKNEYLSVNPIDIGISHSLTNKGFKTWLTAEREASVSWDYTERYLKYLSNNGRSQKVVEDTADSSLSIVKKIADPKSQNSVFLKGLVVGAVQSGKTGNFNAVINRAIDTGYVLVIVLSGIIEDLRNQTQKRIEKEVIGEGTDDYGIISKIGVGEINRFGPLVNSPVVQVSSITSAKKDFTLATKELDFTLNAKYVLVCKKNVSVLRNLIVWLHDSLENGKLKHNIPLLILDDEADNASLNNLGSKGREYASKTNIQIRALLALFNIKTYLGYTATPFANVLQDRNEVPVEKYKEKYKIKGESFEKELQVEGNIFPDDFIELLDTPSNYVGAKQIFETITPIENSTDDNDKIPLVAPVVTDYVEDFPTRVYSNKDGDAIGIENFTEEEWDEQIGENGYLDWKTYQEYRKPGATRAANKDDIFPKKLPESLKDAIKCFILSLAIRQSRIHLIEKSILYNPHNTMLIHISRFTIWQNTTKKLVAEYVNDLISKINNDNPGNNHSIYFELEKIWYRYYAHIVENIKKYLPHGYEDEFMVPIVFDSVKKLLPEAIKGIEIKAINSSTGENLEYPKNNPKKIIAIGGNRLSRGFTLEGLTINYFIRTTNYSDALLQMGRWFGYRPGYLDCCKIFTTQDSLDKFNSTTRCIEELEIEFKEMERLKKDPKSFVLRVRKHPGTLAITRPSILKNATAVIWSYQNQLEMTTTFKVTKKHVENTWNNFKINIAPKFNEKRRGLCTFKANGKDIIEILNNQTNNFPKNKSSQMSKFIELCNEKGLLNNWTVALKITGSSKNILLPDKIGLDPQLCSEIQLAARSGPKKDSNDEDKFLKKSEYRAASKNANIISDNTDLAVLLDESDIKKAEEIFYQNKAKELQKKSNNLTIDEALNQVRKKIKNVPDTAYRSMFTENDAVLVIYLLDSEYAFNQKSRTSIDKDLKEKFLQYINNNGINTSIPLVGYAIGFPPMETEVGGEYMQYDDKIDDEPEEFYEDELPEDKTEL